jgi:NAD(P)H-quinone oxidoreductase subunit 4L
MEVTLTHYLVLSGVVFSIGLFGALAKRNAVAILMAIELMFNAVNIAFISFASFAQPFTLAGQVFSLFVIAVAAAEATVALAIILAIYRIRKTINIEDINLMRW